MLLQQWSSYFYFLIQFGTQCISIFSSLITQLPPIIQAKTKLKRINDRILYFKFFFRIIIMIIIINRHDFSLVLLFSFIDYLMINSMWIL